ncbi:MAG: desulfoferrodoxin [Nitrososphaerota archaeon]|jgi:superoxide reductase|nr:desulfoferrodoxin [Nitrososphaerota archaeon]
MRDSQKFFFCKHCKNITTPINDKGTTMMCCGEKMTELMPNTVEASVEKHLPVIGVLDDSLRVEIGSVPHPMQDDHYIVFIYVETEHGGQCKYLSPGEEPKLAFSFSNDKPVAVYAYCNLHGLWKTKI